MEKLTKQELLAALLSILDDLNYSKCQCGGRYLAEQKLNSLIREVRKRELGGSILQAAREDYEVNE